MHWVLIGLGGALGAILRAALAAAILRGVSAAPALPYATLSVNVLGALFIGICAAILPRDHTLYPLLVVGLLGGFTTFSAFSLELFQLLEKGQLIQAALYSVGSVLLTLIACAAGYYFSKGLLA